VIEDLVDQGHSQAHSIDGNWNIQ